MCELGEIQGYSERDIIQTVGEVQSRVFSLSAGVKVIVGQSRVVVFVSEWYVWASDMLS